MTINDPHEARIDVRTATYPNTQAERDAVAALDRVVFDKVRVVEDFMASQAETFLQKHEGTIHAAIELQTQLREEIVPAGAVDFDGDLGAMAARLTIIRSSAERASGDLERAAVEAEWRADQVGRPYERYREIMNRYPALSRGFGQ